MSSIPAQPISINLLGQGNLNASVIDRLISWAITYGRYIMIATEVIVLLAFISRFSLDRKLVDLREEIEQKKIILQANQQFEEEFKNLKKKLLTTKSLLDNQNDIFQLLSFIQTVIPSDTYITEFSISGKTMHISATSGNTESLSFLVSQMSQEQQFSSIEVSNIRRSPTKGLEFQIKASLK